MLIATQMHGARADEPFRTNLRLHIENRAAQAFDRFADRVAEAEVRVGDENGPRGGVDQVGRVRFLLARGGELVVEDRDRDAFVMIDRLMTRAARVLAKHFERSRRGAGDRVSAAGADQGEEDDS
jgi:hypothetical protein